MNGLIYFCTTITKGEHLWDIFTINAPFLVDVIYERINISLLCSFSSIVLRLL